MLGPCSAAARPRTLTLATTPILAGTALAGAESAVSQWPTLLATFLSTLLIQVGTNLHNVTWTITFRMGATPAVFQGLFNRLGEKGDEFNYQPTADETLLRTAVLLDIGTHTRTPTLNVEMHF